MNRIQVDRSQWTAESGENRERAARSICNLQFAISNLHSSFSPLSPHPSPLMRRGLSLLEVLISIGVLAVGLLGVIAIIPLGQMTIAESVKADRAAACGRAVMRDVKVRRMLDFRFWQGTAQPPFTVHSQIPFVVDPWGSTQPLPSAMSHLPTPSVNVWLPRVNLFTDVTSMIPLNRPQAESIFTWPDDFTLDTPENPVERPLINPTVGLGNYRSIDYSWLFSVSPASSEQMLPMQSRRLFDVTVAVFFKRNFNLDANNFPEGEWVADVQFTYTPPPDPSKVSPGGGTITLTDAYRIKDNAGGPPVKSNSIIQALPQVRDNQWVMLYGQYEDPVTGNFTYDCQWYRVVGVNFPETPTPTNQPTLTLDGPDWKPWFITKLIVIDGAIGTYTSTVELDYDPLWQSMY